jgi:hypothetical protein
MNTEETTHSVEDLSELDVKELVDSGFPISDIMLTSISISLKRIVDILEKDKARSLEG